MNVSKELKSNLRKIFKHNDYLNESQQKAAEQIYEGKHDVIVRGFGKSLCYQLPVLTKDNSFIIVITSSNGYIQSQRSYLEKKQIKTCYLTSGTSRKKRIEIEEGMISKKSTMKILFITPHQYQTSYFTSLLKKVDVQRLLCLVVHEADNILSGQQFIKKQYQNLDLKIVKVPIVALSATANSKVQEDLTINFQLKWPRVFAMPVLRIDPYIDVCYIDILPDPIAHLINYINHCFCLKSQTNSNDKGSLGLIVCKDVETTVSLAKYFTSIGIPALPYSTILKKRKSKNENLKNVKEVRILTVCEEVNVLSVKINLAKIIAEKSVTFLVHWFTVPSIQKYYLQLSQTQCFGGIFYCRIYCLLEDLTNNCEQSSCLNYGSVDVKNSLLQIQCRHKIYSKFYGNEFVACEDNCDVCNEREKVKQILSRLLEISNNENMQQSHEKVPEISKNYIHVSNKNLQNESLKERVSRKYQTGSKVNDARTKSNVSNACHDQENINILKKPIEVCDKNLQNEHLRVSRKHQTKRHVNHVSTESNDDNLSVDTNNKMKDDKKSAVKNLSITYTKMWGPKQFTRTSTKASTQSSNNQTVNSSQKNDNNSKKVIVIEVHDESSDEVLDCNDRLPTVTKVSTQPSDTKTVYSKEKENSKNSKTSKSVRNDSDSHAICRDKKISANVLLHPNKELIKASTQSSKTTIINSREKKSLQNSKTTKSVSNDCDSDVICKSKERPSTVVRSDRIPILTKASTKPSNTTTVKLREKNYLKNSKPSKEVSNNSGSDIICISDEELSNTVLHSSSRLEYTPDNDRNDDSVGVCTNEGSSSNKVLCSNNSKDIPKTQTSTTNLVTKFSVKNKTIHVQKDNICNSDKSDDDKIFIEEIIKDIEKPKSPKKKRPHSATQDVESSSTSTKRNKRFKLGYFFPQ